MTTLLDEVNNILLVLNEQPVASVFDTDVALKVRLAIQQALSEVVAYNNLWPWLQAEVTGTWSTSSVTLNESVLDVIAVRYETQQVLWLPEIDFNKLTSVSGASPKWYTRIGDTYYFNPYPTEMSEQQKVRFRIVKDVTSPQVDDDVMPVPSEFLPVVRYGALSELFISHLANAQMSNYYKQKYADNLRSLKSRRISAELRSQSVIGN